MFKRITEIKSQPVLILKAGNFLRLEGLAEIRKRINDQLKETAGPRAIILPPIVSMDGWQYGKVETITETTDEEPPITYTLQEAFTPDQEGGADHAETADAAGPAGDL